MSGNRGMPDRRSAWWRSRWWMPVFSLSLGVVMLAAYAISDRADAGARSFAIMAIVAAIFAGGSRSETLRGLGGPGRDERWAFIDVRANAFAGLVVIAAILIAWLLEVAKGHDGSPYGQLAAVAGFAYIAAIAWLRWRT